MTRQRLSYLADGVQEAIYTIAEAQEFIKLPVEQRAYVHTWKAGLNGTVEAVRCTYPA
jgi:hypothetical protein